MVTTMQVRLNVSNKVYKVLKIYADESQDFVIEHSYKMPLEELQNHVGGHIEVIPCVWKGMLRDMIINEEGKLEHLAINQRATDMHQATRQFGYIPQADDFVVGNALVLLNYKLS